MAGKRSRSAVGLAAAAFLLLSVAGPSANATEGMPGFARLGPPNAPVKLFYEEKGQGSPVLLIHGFGASTYTWRRIAPALAETHRVIAVDLKGFGQSDKPFDERYSIVDQAELLKQLIAENDLQDIPVAFRMLDMPVVSHLGVRMLPPAVQARLALRIAYLDNSKIEDEEVEMYAAPLRTAAGKHAIIHSARQIMPEGLEEISERYKTIAVPTLIGWCDHDRIVPLDVGLKLRRTLPNAHLKIIDDCGHMPQEEQPEATLELIQNFLAD